MLFEGQICRIGQKERCEATDCEWKKHFNHNCWLRPKEPEVKEEVKKEIWSPKFVPAEDTNPFYAKRRKKGRVVKEEKKYTEVKNIVPKVKNLKEEENFVNKITTAKQDDWIAKIKSV